MRIVLQIFVFIAIGGLLGDQSFGQQKCKFEYEENDPFTAKLSKGTLTAIFPISITTKESWYVGFDRLNDEFSIVNNINLSGKLSSDINLGDSIMFATNDGSIITCYAIKTISPITNIDRVMNNKIITSGYISKYPISKEQLEVLADSELTNIRMNIGDKIYQQKVKAKHARDFQNDARCILK